MVFIFCVIYTLLVFLGQLQDIVHFFILNLNSSLDFRKRKFNYSTERTASSFFLQQDRVGTMK